MQTLTAETTRSEKRTVEIPIPFFSRTKDETNYLALLDSETVVRVYVNKNCSIVTNAKVDVYEMSKIVEAWETWHSCTETEFLEKYDAVIESISLHPKLAV